jgi:1-aminocyclopropane-1-carboxylate deaminase
MDILQFEKQYLNLPSPVEEINDVLFEEKQINVFVKRDDLIHPIISGNKWRKLREYIQFAQLKGIMRVISFGGAYSNHLYALAYATKILGIQSIGIIRGEELNPKSNPYLTKMQEWGMELHFMTRAEYQRKLIPESINQINCITIAEGGFGKEAIAGIVALANEIQSLGSMDHLFCPIGTGATYLGISQSLPEVKIHGVLTLNNKEEIKANSAALSIPIQELHDNYIFGKYAKQSFELEEFCTTFYQKHHIKIEPIYTGRMFYGLYDLISKDYFKPGSQIMAIHTGGVKV